MSTSAEPHRKTSHRAKSKRKAFHKKQIAWGKIFARKREDEERAKRSGLIELGVVS